MLYCTVLQFLNKKKKKKKEVSAYLLAYLKMSFSFAVPYIKNAFHNMCFGCCLIAMIGRKQEFRPTLSTYKRVTKGIQP